MPKIFVFTSALGGVGQSTLCVHLAHALAARGKKVILLDLSISRPALDSYLGVADEVVYTLPDLLGDRVKAERAVLPVSTDSGCEGEISLLPVYPLDAVDTRMLAEPLLAHLRALDADFILIDADGETYPAVAPLSDERLLLLSPREPSVRNAEALVVHLTEKGCAPDAFLLMRAALCVEALQKDTPLLSLIDRLSTRVLGIVPYAPRLYDMKGMMGKKHRREPYAIAVQSLAARLLGESVPLLTGVPVEGISRRAYLERA